MDRKITIEQFDDNKPKVEKTPVEELMDKYVESGRFNAYDEIAEKCGMPMRNKHDTIKLISDICNQELNKFK